MGTRDTIRFQDKTDDLPGWKLYTEIFETEDTVYLELRGVPADVTMTDSVWGHLLGTAVLRLRTATARQLGLVPQEWTRDQRWFEE